MLHNHVIDVVHVGDREYGVTLDGELIEYGYARRGVAERLAHTIRMNMPEVDEFFEGVFGVGGKDEGSRDRLQP